MHVGLHEVGETRYLRPAPLPELPPLLCLLLISLAPRYAVSAASFRLVLRREKRPTTDPVALTAGCALLLRQHHPAHLQARTSKLRNSPGPQGLGQQFLQTCV